MKTVLVELDRPATGDLVILSYRSPRGGRTDAKHTIGPGETQATVLREIGGQIGRSWMTDHFQARLNIDRAQLIVNCSDAVSNVTFSAEVEGGGGTTVKITEF